MGRVKDSSDRIRGGIPHITEADIADIVSDIAKSKRIDILRTAFSNNYFDVCPFNRSTGQNPHTPAYTLIHALHCKHFSQMSEQTKHRLWLAALECAGVSPGDFPYPFYTNVILRKWKVNWHMDIFFAATAAFCVGTVMGLVLGSSQPSVDHLPHQNGAAVIADAHGAGAIKPLRTAVVEHGRLPLHSHKVQAEQHVEP